MSIETNVQDNRDRENDVTSEPTTTRSPVHPIVRFHYGMTQDSKTVPEILESIPPDSNHSSLRTWGSLEPGTYSGAFSEWPLETRHKHLLSLWKNCKTGDVSIRVCPQSGCCSCRDLILYTSDPRNHDDLNSEELILLERVRDHILSLPDPFDSAFYCYNAERHKVREGKIERHLVLSPGSQLCQSQQDSLCRVPAIIPTTAFLTKAELLRQRLESDWSKIEISLGNCLRDLNSARTKIFQVCQFRIQEVPRFLETHRTSGPLNLIDQMAESLEVLRTEICGQAYETPSLKPNVPDNRDRENNSPLEPTRTRSPVHPIVRCISQ